MFINILWFMQKFFAIHLQYRFRYRNSTAYNVDGSQGVFIM